MLVVKQVSRANFNVSPNRELLKFALNGCWYKISTMRSVKFCCSITLWSSYFLFRKRGSRFQNLPSMNLFPGKHFTACRHLKKTQYSLTDILTFSCDPFVREKVEETCVHPVWYNILLEENIYLLLLAQLRLFFGVIYPNICISFHESEKQSTLCVINNRSSD